MLLFQFNVLKQILGEIGRSRAMHQPPGDLLPRGFHGPGKCGEGNAWTVSKLLTCSVEYLQLFISL